MQLLTPRQICPAFHGAHWLSAELILDNPWLGELGGISYLPVVCNPSKPPHADSDYIQLGLPITWKHGLLSRPRLKSATMILETIQTSMYSPSCLRRSLANHSIARLSGIQAAVQGTLYASVEKPNNDAPIQKLQAKPFDVVVNWGVVGGLEIADCAGMQQPYGGHL